MTHLLEADVFSFGLEMQKEWRVGEARMKGNSRSKRQLTRLCFTHGGRCGRIEPFSNAVVPLNWSLDAQSLSGFISITSLAVFDRTRMSSHLEATLPLSRKCSPKSDKRKRSCVIDSLMLLGNFRAQHRTTFIRNQLVCFHG